MKNNKLTKEKCRGKKVKPTANKLPRTMADSGYECVECDWYLKHKGFFKRRYYCMNKNCKRYGIETIVMKGFIDIINRF